MSGRREATDDKALLSEVSRQLHSAKANKKMIANKRRTAKIAAKKGIAPLPSAPQAEQTKSKSTRRTTTAAEPQNALPPGVIPLKSGGSVWLTFKCELDAIRRRKDLEFKAERGIAPKKTFVLPAENARSRMRAEKAAAAAAEVEAEDEVQDAPAEVVDEAVQEPTEEEQTYYYSALETAIANLGAGATKCIVRTTSSLARKVVKRSKDGAKRRIKKARHTAFLTTQKQASNFVTNLVALLRKDVYPLLHRDAVNEQPAQTATVSAPAAEKSTAKAVHKDPQADVKGKVQTQQQQQRTDKKPASAPQAKKSGKK